jgi:hypothetical protein
MGDPCGRQYFDMGTDRRGSVDVVALIGEGTKLGSEKQVEADVGGGDVEQAGSGHRPPTPVSS